MKKNQEIPMVVKPYNVYELIEEDEAMHKAAIDAFSDYISSATGGGDGFGYGLLSPEISASKLLSLTAARFRMHNERRPGEEQWPVPTELTPHQIALLVLAHHEVRLLPLVDDIESQFLEYLFAYQTEGPKKGLYTIGVRELIKEFEPGIGMAKELQVKLWLEEDAEKGVLCVREDLMAFNDGIYNGRTKALMPFSPEYIFLTKLNLNYASDVR